MSQKYISEIKYNKKKYKKESFKIAKVVFYSLREYLFIIFLFILLFLTAAISQKRWWNFNALTDCLQSHYIASHRLAFWNAEMLGKKQDDMTVVKTVVEEVMYVCW